MRYYGQKVRLLDEKPRVVTVLDTEKNHRGNWISVKGSVVNVETELAVGFVDHPSCIVLTRRDDPGFKRKAMPNVHAAGFKPPAMPDFSLEARQRWVKQTAEARFAASRREDHANAGEKFTADPDHDPARLEDLRVDVTLPVQYPWGKRKKGQVPT